MTRKFALVIGNSHYTDPALARLKAPEADVHALATVLRDPAIGGFDEVNELIDEPEYSVRRAIAAFFASKAPSDLLLLYASGHGVLDDQGRLYLATQDTQRDLLNATAIPTTFITDGMDTCRSKRQVLILDCCHSGAFARGAKGELTAITQATFEGNGFGRVVLTASDSTQYALEGDQVDQNISLSLFTNYLLEGLTTGEADRGRDGWVDVDEWYDYAYEKILLQTSGQTPKKWAYNTQGELVIARNPRPKPVELPRYLRTAIGSELPRVRLEAVEQLENLLGNGEPGLAAVAAQELQRMAQDDDSLIVRKRAAEVLSAHAVASAPPQADATSQAAQVSQVAQEREQQQAQELLEEEQRRQAEEEERRRREQEALRRRQEQERQAQQARLEALYNAVLSKMQAGEWQAAQNSLEELQRAHPGYGDAAKLQKKIAEEIARQKSERERQEQQARQRRLEAQYQDASQAMQREDWMEAQRLFEQLAQDAPGYRDVSKQLRMIAGRLAGEPTTATTRAGWLPVLVTGLGLGIGWALLAPLYNAYRYINILPVAAIPALLISGGVVYSLVLAGLPLSRVRLAQIFLLWWVGNVLVLGFGTYPDWQDSFVMTAVIPIVLMLLVSAGTGLLLRSSIPSLRWISIAGGWALGLGGGVLVIIAINSYLSNNGIEAIEAYALGFGLAGLVIGAVGGGWMHRQLQPFSTLAGEPQAGSLREGTPRRSSALTASAWRNWLPVLTAGLGWGIAWAVLSPLLKNDQFFLGAVISALFMAASMVAAIKMVAGEKISQRRLAQLFGLCWVGLVLALGLAAYPDWQGYPIQGVLIPIALILATFAGTGLLLRASLPSVNWMSILGGLALGLLVGAFATVVIRPVFPYADLHMFGLHDLGGMRVLGIGGLVGGLIGGGWMRWQLSKGV